MDRRDSLGRRSKGRPGRWLRVVAAISLGAAIACEDRRGGTAEVYPDVDATVVSVEVERRLLTVAHEEIPGLMEAMTMPLEVRDPALLDGIAAGQRVRLTLRRVDGQLLVWDLERGPDPAADASPAARAGLLGEAS
jgi:Cu/Ag efflux protein CusF